MFEKAPDVLRVKDVMALLKCSESTVNRLMASGLLAYSKIGRLVYIQKKNLIELIYSSEVEVGIQKEYNTHKAMMISSLRTDSYE